MNRFSGKTVVVTGATAGVGRAVAVAFAKEGARLVLMARDQDALEELKAELAQCGGESFTYPLDVADADAVLSAGEDVEARIGPIDIWVNNAMATVIAKIRDIKPDEFRRVTEVTYLGAVHGTMAALRAMGPRKRGTIVQVGSGLAYRGIPLQAAYCGAKHALRGFTDALRTELKHENSNVKLTMVHLPAINTPQFDWARNTRPEEPRPVAPVYTPEVAAQAILKAAAAPAREYWLGGTTVMMILGNMIFPQMLDRKLGKEGVDGQERGVPRRERPDNLWSSVPGAHRTAGSFGDEARDRALLLPGAAGRMGSVLAGGMLCAAVGGLLLGRRQSRHRLPSSRR
ncbi:SDR family oxidoreductase [Paracoccus sp. (in: a-proteobacteria)]|uniref:SDR family oxidoreductase n=1 Tax=Paracoccus sp. TaxID=267 RepID=UPI00396C7021